MKLKKKYVDINDTLRHIRVQVMHSIPFAREVCPDFQNPAQLFSWLKARTTYKNDPRGVELLQSMQTLFNGDYHGTPGAGDCDCFTIAALACMHVQQWPGPLWIKIAGRDRSAPVHIWAGLDFKGKPFALDLTEKQPDKERSYPFVQKIYYK